MPATTADRLRQIMNEQQLKQADVLRKVQPYCQKYRIKLGKSDLSQFLSGKVKPGQWKLTVLSLALNVSEPWLMGLDVPKERTDRPLQTESFVSPGPSISDFMTAQKAHNTSRQKTSLVSEKEMAHIKKYRVLDIYNKRLVDDVLDAAYNNMTRDINPEERGMAYLNCYELPAAAGTGEPLGDTYYTDKIQIPLNRVPENAHICIRVHGDSMEPAYHDGDIVMVERFDGDSVREGEIGIFILNGEGYIKRLGYGELISLNPAYEPIRVGEFDDLRCMGRVLGKV